MDKSSSSNTRLGVLPRFRSWLALPTCTLMFACAQPGTLLDVVEVRGSPSVRGPLTVAPIRFHLLEGGVVEAEEGRLTVPQRHGVPGSGRLTIHYVRFPARTSDPGSPIVYLAGGPGGSGTASAAGDRAPLFGALRNVADVIALDQRGTWNAEPYMVCPGAWSFPLDRPLSEDALAEAVGPWVAGCHRYWTGRGVDLDAYNTVESAGDLEALRVALGAERLNLLAISYGTHLALAFARLHPSSVDRLVLAGTEGPDQTLKSPASIDAAMARADAFLTARGEAPLTARVRALVQRVRREPVTAPARNPETGAGVSVTVGPVDIQRAIFDGAGERSGLVDLSSALDLAVDGDYSAGAQAVVEWRSANQGLAMSLAMDCSSWASEARLRRIDAEAAESFLDDAANVLIRAQCRSWPGARLGRSYHEPVTWDAPTLFISGGLDARTPVENALEVARGFRDAWHLVIVDGGHDDDLLIASPRIPAAITDFLSGHTPSRRRRDIRIGPVG